MMTVLATSFRTPAPTERAAPLRAPPVLTPITAVAARLGVTSRALRHYEAIGLISSHRGKRDLRLYDRDTVALLETVSVLRRIDVPIAEIRAVMLRRQDQQSYRQALHDLLRTTLLEHRRRVDLIESLMEQLG
jgi:MerR family redox-sensitive transcriptional activator SoxR